MRKSSQIEATTAETKTKNQIKKMKTQAAPKMTYKEVTKHIRNRIAASGINARVLMKRYCGSETIHIVTPGEGFEIKFTESEQREIRLIAKLNGLTLTYGMEIDIERMTNPDQFVFEFRG